MVRRSPIPVFVRMADAFCPRPAIPGKKNGAPPLFLNTKKTDPSGSVPNA